MASESISAIHWVSMKSRRLKLTKVPPSLHGSCPRDISDEIVSPAPGKACEFAARTSKTKLSP